MLEHARLRVGSGVASCWTANQDQLQPNPHVQLYHKFQSLLVLHYISLRMGRKSSIVFNYYTNVTLASSPNVDFVQCNLCNKHIRRNKKYTSNLVKHLKVSNCFTY